MKPPSRLAQALVTVVSKEVHFILVLGVEGGEPDLDPDDRNPASVPCEPPGSPRVPTTAGTSVVHSHISTGSSAYPGGFQVVDTGV